MWQRIVISVEATVGEVHHFNVAIIEKQSEPPTYHLMTRGGHSEMLLVATDQWDAVEEGLAKAGQLIAQELRQWNQPKGPAREQIDAGA